MTERPILFSAPMVRAILAGTKTQTRRALRVQPPENTAQVSTFRHPDPRPMFYAWTRDGGPVADHPTAGAEISEWPPLPCPYGQRGHRLWVRETWMDLQGTGVEHRTPTGKLQRYAYGADTPPGSCGDEARKDFGLKWKPSIHMPRAASRITLEVTGVRVERLQAISEADAEAEGITYSERYQGWCIGQAEHFNSADPRQSYFSLWETINGDGSVDANPWVWVVEFKRVEG